MPPASVKLAAAIQVLLEASLAAENVSAAEVWEAIERVVPRGQVAAALAAVCELAPPPDEQADEAWRAELLKRHATIRPFLPILTEVIEFGAVEDGQLVVEAVQRLPQLLAAQEGQKRRDHSRACHRGGGAWFTRIRTVSRAWWTTRPTRSAYSSTCIEL